MSNLNLKGIWIPIEILINKELSDFETYLSRGYKKFDLTYTKKCSILYLT